MNPAIRLAEAGQSLWYDNIRRGLLRSGELERLTRECGIVGVTSNPTIFERAVATSNDYDDALAALSAQGRSAREIMDRLTLDDIRAAADVLRPAYDATRHRDGRISIEVSPDLAHDTAASVTQARAIWDAVGRPNIMVKVPGTPEGVPAIRQLTSEGISVNVTLLFSLSQYEAIADAYLAGLEARRARGEPLADVASVASFFVSRVDTLIDTLLGERGAPAELLHRAGIANAKVAYARYQQILESPRWQTLARAGARPQRLLWASTSTKNPKLRDVTYVEELIGPDTVNTVPEVTLKAFLDHGRVRPSLLEDVPGARAHCAELERRGIDLEEVGKRLQKEGVASFHKSFEELLQRIETRRQAFRAHTPQRQRAVLGMLTAPVESRAARLASEKTMQRLWAKDASLWKKDPQHQTAIRNRLGWLTSVGRMREASGAIRAFADSVRREGFRHAVLCGMGGSSMCPEVLQGIFGTSRGWLELRVLDSTIPDAVRAAERGLALEKTLFLVASKSGTTTEVDALYRHFAARAKPAQFVAITDPGTPLEERARAAGFREVFLNPADIGGRYSALSFFGLVPAALLGVDIGALLTRAERMVDASSEAVPVAQSAGGWLGAVLGEAVLQGRDKLTLLTAPLLGPFGAWLEQLLAESTGKEGTGIIPVDGEPQLRMPAYGEDRLFVGLGLAREGNGLDGKLAELEAAGQPLVELRLEDRLDLGAEFFRWEIATAVASAVLGVNAFDEPNVQESKDNTVALLAEYRRRGKLPEEPAAFESPEIQVYGEEGAKSAGAILAAHFASASPSEYVALQAYLHRTDRIHGELQRIRTIVGEARRVATTLGYGPRFLHSTGQLHKGGPKSGVFLQITAEVGEDLAVPGLAYSFGTLAAAQAAGDLRALRAKGLRAVRVHLRGEPTEALARLRQELEQTLRGG